MEIKYAWVPDEETIISSNINKMMEIQHFEHFEELQQWSINDPEHFWRDTMDLLEIKLKEKYSKLLDLSDGVENPHWLKGAKMNIVDSCFRNWGSAPAVIFQQDEDQLTICTHRGLHDLVNKVANGLTDLGFKKGDAVAITMPMNIQAVAAYLGIIKAGMVAVTIADSFSAQEIKIRLEITNPKLLITQDQIQRNGKSIPLYARVKDASPPKCVIVTSEGKPDDLRKNDLIWDEFLSSKTLFESVACSPEDPITILFSSGTTGIPKAIPWNHTTPIKAASDGFYHQNIQNGDIVCWPTNLGWMMGPWLVFASLINEAAMALYNDAPTGRDFGEFVQSTGATMLGVVPSLVAQWKSTACMEGLNWNAIRNFSSTGEVSNPEDMLYLMSLAGIKPIIEYCGGTEIGGGYVTGTIIHPAIPGTFTTKALGSDFVLLDENDGIADEGEVFLIPPAMGLSTKLINRDHHEVYFKNVPHINSKLTRKHGDQMVKFPNGYYRARGRVDDTMNLGGIKVSATSIEEIINLLPFIKECAAVAVNPEGGGPSQLFIYAVKNKIDPGDSDALSIIRNLVKKELNPLFKVEELIWIDQLPRTASNKVMRRKLRSDLKTTGKQGAS